MIRRVKCKVWSPVEGRTDGGVCGKGLHRGVPTWSDCIACRERVWAKAAAPRATKRVGPGDVLAAVIHAATFGRVRMCETCGGRRRRLNKLGWLWGVLMPWKWIRGTPAPSPPAPPRAAR